MEQDFYEESPVQQLFSFRNQVADREEIVIPLRPEHRKPTDRTYAITFAVCILILIPFVVYTLSYSNVDNLMRADDCGNFCGHKNKKYDEWNCTGQDFTEKQYLLVRHKGFTRDPLDEEKICVETCPPLQPGDKCLDNGRSNPAEDMRIIMKDIEKGWWTILLSMLITCALCFGMLLLFKYAVSFLVWFLLIGGIGVMAIAAGALWKGYFHYKDDALEKKKADGFLYPAIVMTTIVILMVVLLTCFIKRVQLIIQLFKESARAIFEIPGLPYMPILTFIAVAISTIGYIVLVLGMVVARKLIEVVPNRLEYDFDGAMIFAIIYNFFMYLWLSLFLTGAQYIIIAGAVSAWFFARNKNYLDSPLWTSFMNFIKFHLGTVFIGSLIITIVTFIKMLLKALSSNSRTRWIVECCCNELIAFLKFFSKNSYIQTAMHGQPFFKSGKRAVKLLISNVENVVAINSLGDFVLGMAQVVLIVVGGALGVILAQASGNARWDIVGFICCVFTFFMVTTFFGIFEATIDSMFMCFCEDTLINDGMARPYCMTKGLRQFIESCKGVFPANKQTT